MAEKLRIESLNVRGLRDRTKRCDILDRAKQRHADIILLQETHWIETDYTDIRDDWNIEVLISGNSTASRGTAILLNKTFEYKIHKTIMDENGRYSIIDIEITLIGRVTICSVYSPNENIEPFIEELFEKINSINNVFHIIGGDWNMIQNFELDTYNYEKWNDKKASKLLEDKKIEFELVDIWRIKNDKVKRYSWWKKTPRKAGRLDYFLVSEQLTARTDKVEIMSPYKTDHGVISIEIIISQEPRGPGYRKLNTELLKEQDLQTQIREELKLIKRTYALTPYDQNNLEINELNIEYSIKPDIMWEVMLVQLRGIILDFAKKKKKKNIEGKRDN